MQTILSKYFAYFVAPLSFSSTPQIVSDTIGPLEKSKSLKWAVILWLISGDHTLSSGQQRPAVGAAVFLWVQYNSPATHNHYYHCSCSLASDQIMRTGLGQSENLNMIKPDGPTRTHAVSLSVTLIRLETFNLFTSCDSNNDSVCWGCPKAKGKFTSPSSCS